MRVAAIDCGTNSIRLLIADVVGEELTEIKRSMTIVRLGEGIDRTGAFSAAALDRTFAACDDYAAVIARADVERTRFVATSASRDASNRAEFIAGVRQRLGVDPEVISGSDEARLSFVGAVAGLPAQLIPAPRLVVDIGGGSTEFVLGDSAPSAAISVDIGCVRMTERHLRSDPPTLAEVAATEADIARALDQAAQVIDWSVMNSCVGVAGTVTTVVALARGLDEYDPRLIHGQMATLAEVEQITARLQVLSRAERAALPVMHPGRVDVIAGGAMVLRAIMRRSGAPSVVASETDILDGVARHLAL